MNLSETVSDLGDYITLDGIEIRIIKRNEATRIDPAEWDQLAEKAITPNPFYERWCLLPALKQFDKNKKVYVVTIYLNKRLIALFPVCHEKKALLFGYLSVWQYRDCLLTDILYSLKAPVPESILAIIKHFRSLYMVCATHSSFGFPLNNLSTCCQIKRTRKAILSPKTWDGYLAKIPGKMRKENKRVISRLFKITNAQYVTSEIDLNSKWLPLYNKAELSSWKSRNDFSIAEDHERKEFFSSAMKNAEPLHKVEFQALITETDVLAISFRFRSHHNAYEIKTCYNEKFRSLYPGVVLELLNLKHIIEADFELADSCAVDNGAVERIWPDEIDIYRTTLFKPSLISRIVKAIYIISRRLKTAIKNNKSALFCR